MLDPQDEQFDRRLGTHLVSLYNLSRQEKEVDAFMDMESLRDYIAFARSISPGLSDDAGDALIEAYISECRIC